MADMVLASDDSDDEPDYAQQEQEKVDETYKKIKKGKIKFNTSTLDEHGNWRASGELRKKKQGKGWKVRYCHIEGQQFWYGDTKKFLTNKGRGAKYFELEGCVLKNYDSLGFTVVPRKGPNVGEQMIFQGLPMKSKRIPDWIDCIKEILGILEDSDEEDEEDDEDDEEEEAESD